MANEKKVLIIGDVHGKIGGYFDLLKNFTERYSRTDETYSIQLGDFGFSDTYQQREKRFERSGRFDPKKHTFFGGNHDDYDKYEDTVGSLGHFGEVSFIEDSFFVRGAKSLDKEARTLGYDWWPAEELGWKQSKKAIQRYISVNPRVMFSHDAPQGVADKMFPSKRNFTTNTGMMLQTMFEQHQPEKWFFGHWHRNKTYEKSETTFQCLKELGTQEINIGDYV